MPRVMVAAPPFALSTLQKILEQHVELVPVATVKQAKEALNASPDLQMVICGVHFDESRMYDLLQYATKNFPQLPIMCVRVLDAEVPRISRESIRLATEALGALAFIDFADLRAKRGSEEAAERLLRGVLASLPGKAADGGGGPGA